MTRAIASCALAGALLWACAEKKEAPRAPERARPLQALPPAGIPKAAPPELPGARRSVPSSAEAELALTLGKALLEDAKPEEAEVQLKVAAAGGRPGADELLLKVQSELEAKRRLADARRKFEARDWPGATEALAGVAPESSLRARADEIADEIAAAKVEESERMKRRMEKELDRDSEPGVRTPDEAKASPGSPRMTPP